MAAAAVAVLAVLTAGCDAGGRSGSGSTPVDPASVTKSRSDGEFESTLTLDDGRQVRFRLAAGTGLQAGHRAGASGSWTGWRTVYRTKADRCQGVELSAYHGTVAVIADYGSYCYDGEPPQRSLALVGTGDLTGWQVDVVKGFDGWAKTAFAGGGARVTFSENNTLGQSTLVWREGSGFGDAVVPQPPKDRIDAYFIGDWVTADGAHRVRIEEPEPGAGLATFSTVGGAACTATAKAAPEGTDDVDLSDGRLVHGAKGTGCPPDTQLLDIGKGTGGTIELVNPVNDKPAFIYSRV